MRLLMKHSKRWIFVTVFLVGFTGFFTYSSLADEPVHTVTFIVDFGDGFQKRYTALPWTKGMSMADALSLASRHPHGVTYQDPSGSFVLSIDGVMNEGGGADKRNWLYWVNGMLGQVAHSVAKLQPEDVGLWKFSVYTDH